MLLPLLARAQTDLIPSTNQTDWSAGTKTGVMGGIPSYATIVDLTQSPYLVTTNTATMTGTLAFGSTSMTVSGNTDFAVGHGIFLHGDSGSTNLLTTITAIAGSTVTIATAAPDTFTSATVQHDNAAVVLKAINTVSSNTVMTMPAGRFDFLNNCAWSQFKHYIVLRGAGTNTIINLVGASAGLQLGVGVTFNFPSSGNMVTAGQAKGSTNITMANASQFTVGRLVELAISTTLNGNTSPTYPMVSVHAYDEIQNNQAMRQQKLMVMAKTSTVLTVWPPLVDDYSAYTNFVYDSQLDNIGDGIEDIYVEATNSTNPNPVVKMLNCYGCWFKNVTVHQAHNYDMGIADSLCCEVRHCKLDGINHGGSNGSGFLMDGFNSSCLIEDNIMLDSQPNIEVNHGCCGNAFGYNFFRNTNGTSAAILGDHDPYNNFNIYEGNYCSSAEWDSYFGGTGSETFFRNWVTGGWGGGSSNAWSFALVLKRFNWYFNIMGNVIGTATLTNMPNNGQSYGFPNIGNANFTGSGPPWIDQWTNYVGMLSMSGSTVTVSSNIFNSSEVWNNADIFWQIIVNTGGYRSYFIASYSSPTSVQISGSGSFTNVDFILSPGQSGWQELDTNVQNTALIRGNYNYFDAAIPSGEAIGATNLPDSYVHASKPAFFGNCPWPWVNSKNVAGLVATNFPAGFRFVTGQDPTNGGGPIDYNQKVWFK